MTIRQRLTRSSVLITVLVALGTSCSVPSTPDGSVVGFVVGARANASAPALVGTVPALVEDAARARASAVLVVGSGEPTILTQGQLGSDCHNAAACAEAARAATQAVVASVTRARAENPESNLLGAIHTAARVHADHPGPRTLVVVDSGLQTVAPLRFQDPGVLDADPQEVADYLGHTGQLPDLTGVEIVVCGIGDTAPPQEQLSPRQRTHLKAIWETIFWKAGVADVRILEAPLTAAPPPGLPPVTPVPVGIPPSFTGTSVDLSDAVLPFVPDTATFRDPASARTTLALLAQEILRAHSPVMLIGATADVGPIKGQQTLGKARAEAVRTVLVTEMGVPADLVTTEGVGSAWPGHIPDHDADGVFLPGPAAHNRKVVAEFTHS